MKTNILKVAALASALVLGNASATQIYVDLDDGGATPTAAIDTLNVFYNSHTTINLATNAIVTVGGVHAVGEDFGFLTADVFDDVDELVGCPSCGSTNTLTSDPNVFTNAITDEYFTSDMRLTYGVDLAGFFDGTDLNYTSGVLDLYSYEVADPNATITKVFTSTFVSGGVSVGNQIVQTLISDSAQVLVDDTFFIKEDGLLTSFEDYIGTPAVAEVRITVEQFVDAAQLADDIAAAVLDPEQNDGAGLLPTVHVTARHNAEVTFDVPEPTSIAILGLGLLGMAGLKRRKA